jgi:hypothetical protein
MEHRDVSKCLNPTQNPKSFSPFWLIQRNLISKIGNVGIGQGERFKDRQQLAPIILTKKTHFMFQNGEWFPLPLLPTNIC